MSCIGNPACIETVANRASDFGNKILLQKQLASLSQMSEAGRPLAGNGTSQLLRAGPRLAATYGGQVSDWSKMTSSNFTAIDGVSFETHWYANKLLEMAVEFKTKIIQ
jgi:filamentous hemagglutinin